MSYQHHIIPMYINGDINGDVAYVHTMIHTDEPIPLAIMPQLDSPLPSTTLPPVLYLPPPPATEANANSPRDDEVDNNV